MEDEFAVGDRVALRLTAYGTHGATAHGSCLQGISDRLAALGGTLAISSRPGQGTTITGRLPVRSGGDRGDHVQPGGAAGRPDPGQDAGERAQDQEQDQLQRRRREHGQRSAAG